MGLEVLIWFSVGDTDSGNWFHVDIFCWAMLKLKVAVYLLKFYVRLDFSIDWNQVLSSLFVVFEFELVVGTSAIDG